MKAVERQQGSKQAEKPDHGLRNLSIRSTIQRVQRLVIQASHVSIDSSPDSINCHCVTTHSRANGTRATMARTNTAININVMLFIVLLLVQVRL